MAARVEAPYYRVFSLSLDSAGSYVLSGELGMLHLVRASTDSGALALDTLVNVKLGDSANDDIPVSFNGKIDASGFDRARFSWAAQADVTAYFALSRSSQRFSIDAPPAKQLVTAAIAGSATYARETVGTSAAAILAANGTRFSAGVMADASNSGVIYVASDAAVTASTGWPLAAGERIVFQHTARLDAIASASGQILHVFEEDS